MDPVDRSKFDEEFEKACRADEIAGRSRSWAAIASDLLGGERCPEISAELILVQVAHLQMGVDHHGRALLSEMELWWRDEGVTDPGQRDAFRGLWRALESERARVEWEQIKNRQTTPS